MDKKVFTEGMARLMLNFTEDQPTPLQVEEYWRELSILPGKVFRAGVDKIVRTREWPKFPKVGEVMRASVDGHWHVVSWGVREPTLDHIVEGYRRRYEIRIEGATATALPRPQLRLAATAEPEPGVENDRLKRALTLAEQRVVRLEEELEESKQKVDRLTKETRAQGEELARLEALYREKKLFLAK
jgi:hypothetical protein